MRNFKSRLTRIKSLIDLKLPDGADIYGFSGVTKSMLRKTCDEMYLLSEKIESKDESEEFEVLALTGRFWNCSRRIAAERSRLPSLMNRIS